MQALARCSNRYIVHATKKHKNAYVLSATFSALNAFAFTIEEKLLRGAWAPERERVSIVCCGKGRSSEKDPPVSMPLPSTFAAKRVCNLPFGLYRLPPRTKPLRVVLDSRGRLENGPLLDPDMVRSITDHALKIACNANHM